MYQIIFGALMNYWSVSDEKIYSRPMFDTFNPAAWQRLLEWFRSTTPIMSICLIFCGLLVFLPSWFGETAQPLVMVIRPYAVLGFVFSCVCLVVVWSDKLITSAKGSYHWQWRQRLRHLSGDEKRVLRRFVVADKTTVLFHDSIPLGSTARAFVSEGLLARTGGLGDPFTIHPWVLEFPKGNPKLLE